MARPVLLILLLIAGWWWLSRQGVRNARPTSPGPSAPAGRQHTDETAAPEPIEQCDVCGVHAPRAGMVALRGGRYRCAEHASQPGRSDA